MAISTPAARAPARLALLAVTLCGFEAAAWQTHTRLHPRALNPPSRDVARTTRPSPILRAAVRELVHLEDEAEYNAKITQAKEENRVVVIKFYASWCRACKAMAPKYERVAEDWPDVEFCDILFDNNKKLCKSLGIKILPYVEVIVGSQGKVDGFSCGPSKISRLQERLEVHGGCEEIPCTDLTTMFADF